MSRGSSIHFEKTKETSAQETTRTFAKEQNYLLPKDFRKENEFWTINNIPTEKADREIFDEILKKAKGKGKRPSFENSIYEAVVNLESHHTMQDLHNLAKHIEAEFGFTCTRIAIHRDEGHLKKSENGKDFAIYNYHAHLNFITINEQGKQCWQPRGMHPKKWIDKLSNLQSETAKILKMARGVSGGKRLNFREYRKSKQAQESTKQTLEKSKVTKKFLGFIPFLDEKELDKQLQEVQKKAFINAETQERERLIASNQNQLNELKEQKEKMEKAVSETNRAFKEQAQELDNREQELQRIKEQQEKEYENKLQELNTKINEANEAEREANILKSEYEEKIKSTETSALLSQNEALQKDNAEANNTIKSLKQKAIELNTTMQKQSNRIKELENNNISLFHKNQDLQNSNAELSSENNELKGLVKSYKELFDNMLRNVKATINYFFSGLTVQKKEAIKSVMQGDRAKQIPTEAELEKIESFYQNNFRIKFDLRVENGEKIFDSIEPTQEDINNLKNINAHKNRLR